MNRKHTRKGGIEMIKKVVMITLLFSISMMATAKTKVVQLAELNKPEQRGVVIDQGRMYVVEGPSVLIYSMKDFKLIKKFGKRGEGPREFMTSAEMGPLGALFIDIRQDKMLVKSFGKLSWYTLDGAFIREGKPETPMMFSAYQFGKHILVQKFDMGNVRYYSLAALDQNLKVVKELMKVEDPFQFGKGIEVLKINPLQVVYKDKLFMAWENSLSIKVLDLEFKELYSIKHPLKRTKVPEGDKKKIIDYFKTSPMTKNAFEILKPIRFPEYYPAVADMSVSGGKLYVYTFSELSDKGDIRPSPIYIFDIKGIFLKKVVFPMKLMDPLFPYPTVVHEGKIYQIVENEDEEQWEVHIDELN
jgi:hypothetical protein